MITSSKYDVKIKPEYAQGERKTYSVVQYDSPTTYNFTSRYKYARRVIENDMTREYHESLNEQEIPETEDDRFITIDNVNRNRLDIVAYQKYGSPKYWWVLAIANNIEDSFNVPIGTVIRVPPLSSLYIDGGVLNGE